MLFQFGNFDLTEYMVAGSYDPIPNARFDLDSYTDAKGVTQRTALAHTRTKVTFRTVEMDAATMEHIMTNIVGNYIDYKERNADCTYYDTENFVIKTGRFYLDSNFKQNVKYADPITKLPTFFGETTFIFTEY